MRLSRYHADLVRVARDFLLAVWCAVVFGLMLVRLKK